jgi:mannitol/fructose-specific phosphotransferase system IIA component (Ntr-type)
VTDTILRFAREYRVANIIIGRPRQLPWWRRLIGERSVAEELIHRAEGLSVIVVDVEAVEDESPLMELPSETLPPQPIKAAAAVPEAPSPKRGQTIGDLLTPQRIVIWDDSVTKADTFRRMAGAIANGDGTSVDTVVQKLEERERTGSTFLNEGVALPHARVDGLTEPQIAIGLTHEGVLDAPTEKPIEVVFMLLSPASGANAHLQLLAKAGRLLQNRELRRRLSKTKTPEAALDEIRAWEGVNQPTSNRL